MDAVGLVLQNPGESTDDAQLRAALKQHALAQNAFQLPRCGFGAAIPSQSSAIPSKRKFRHQNTSNFFGTTRLASINALRQVCATGQSMYCKYSGETHGSGAPSRWALNSEQLCGPTSPHVSCLSMSRNW